MKDRHWASLVTSLQHGQCVLIVGPEIAAEPIPEVESDDELQSYAERLSRRLVEELEEDGHRVTGATLAAIAQQYEDAKEFGPSALRAAAENFYGRGYYAPSSQHVALASLPFSLIITTCHDGLLTQALKAIGKNPIVVRYNLRGDREDNHEFTFPGSPDTPIIYHLFGEVREPMSMILSENDVLDFIIAIVSERPPLPNSLTRALKRNGQTFLFAGFGIRHWYLRILLKIIVRALELHRTGSAIATEPLRGLSETDREQTILFYQRGTRIEVEDSECSDFLKEVSRRLAAGGGYLARAKHFGPRARVFISYAREDEDIAARLFDAMQQRHFEPWLDTEALRGGDDWDRRIRDELDTTDFVVILYTPALCRKIDSYVNREIAIARSRALAVRGRFLLPLRITDISAEERIDELREYQDELLRVAHFDDDIERLTSILLREYQRRRR